MTIAVTEIDYKWIKRQYTASAVYVSDMICFKRGKLPEWLKSKVMEYFTNKSTLKHTEPVLYAKSKNLLNGIYGMTATAIIRPSYIINQDSIIAKAKAEDADEDDRQKLKKYYSSHNSFMAYQWALYTTAFARDSLMTMIESTGNGAGVVDIKHPENDDLTAVYENFLYCDTDSVFYIKTPQNRANMDEYEHICIKRAKDGGAYVGDNFLGAPTDEPHIRAFRGLHAKCYAMEELNEKIRKKTHRDLDQQQREYYLQQQIKNIQEELGGNVQDQDAKECTKNLLHFLITVLRIFRRHRRMCYRTRTCGLLSRRANRCRSFRHSQAFCKGRSLLNL